MVTSFDNFRLIWKFVSSKTEEDCVTSEYECKLPSEYSDRKYHMFKMVSPQKESISCSVR